LWGSAPILRGNLIRARTLDTVPGKSKRSHNININMDQYGRSCILTESDLSFDEVLRLKYVFMALSYMPFCGCKAQVRGHMGSQKNLKSRRRQRTTTLEPSWTVLGMRLDYILVI
jgi:hypothetical protein